MLQQRLQAERALFNEQMAHQREMPANYTDFSSYWLNNITDDPKTSHTQATNSPSRQYANKALSKAIPQKKSQRNLNKTINLQQLYYEDLQKQANEKAAKEALDRQNMIQMELEMAKESQKKEEERVFRETVEKAKRKNESMKNLKLLRQS